MNHRTTSLMVICLVLVGCANTAFKPTEVSPSGMPYEGLNENSYGPRSTNKLRDCDPDAIANSQYMSKAARDDVNEMAHGMAASMSRIVGAPIQGMTVIDSSIVDLGLDGIFKIPSDSNHPTVAVLSHTESSIVFWHSTMMVRVGEVTTAAQAYCAKRQKPLLYRGSASRCPPVERSPLTGKPIFNTYAISAFACTGP
jgi:hypothetical protein